MAGWTKIDNERIEQAHQVGPTAFVVYCLLQRHVGEGGDCWPSVTRLSRLANTHRATTIRAIEELEAAGWIAVRRTHGRGNRYTFPPVSTGSTDATSSTGATGSTDATPPVAPVLPDQSRQCYPTSRASATRTRPKEQDPRTTSSPSPLTADAWQEAEEAVGQIIGEHAEAIARCQAAGVSPAYVLACVDWFRPRLAVGDYGAGALYHRLCSAMPSQRPDDPATWAPAKPRPKPKLYTPPPPPPETEPIDVQRETLRQARASLKPPVTTGEHTNGKPNGRAPSTAMGKPDPTRPRTRYGGTDAP